MLRKVFVFIAIISFILPIFSGIGIIDIAPNTNPFYLYDRARTKMLEGKKPEASVTEPGSGSFIIKFKDTAPLADIHEIISEYSFDLLGYSELRMFRVVLDDCADLEKKSGDLLEFIEEDTVCVFAEIEEESTDLPDGTLTDNNMWELEMINAYNVWEISKGSRDVVVAVIDSGVNRTHKAFKNSNILEGYNFLTNQKGNVEDKHGHGTKVTGIIAGSGEYPVGAAPGVTVLPLKITDEYTFNVSTLISAINYAADYSVSVINLSLGATTRSAGEEAAVKNAINKGCIVVSAAGNGGNDIYYPAGYDGVIGVGMVNARGNVSSSSQTNKTVDIVAPGESITTLKYENNESKTIFDKGGTSFAAAYVSAAAALILSVHDQPINSYEFEKLIEYSTKRERDDYYGWGLIDITALMDQLKYPIILGVSDNQVYFEPVSAVFKYGRATLDGEDYKSGNQIITTGSHVLEVIDGTKKRTVNFYVDTADLTYDYTKANDYFMFEFNRGTATLDGYPYISGTKIYESGDYVFELTGSNGNQVSEKIRFIKELPTVFGVENGAVYNNPVMIRLIGNGRATIDGKTVEEDVIIYESGEYVLKLENINGNKTETIKFKIDINNIQKLDVQNKKTAGIEIDEVNGFIAIYSSGSTDIHIRDIKNPGTNLKVIAAGKTVEELHLLGKYMVASFKTGFAVYDRSLIMGTENPKTADFNTSSHVLASVLISNNIYYLNNNSELRKIDVENKTDVLISKFNIKYSSLGYSKGYLFLYSEADPKNPAVYSIASGKTEKWELGIDTGAEKIMVTDEYAILGSHVFDPAGRELLYTIPSDSECAYADSDILIISDYLVDIKTGRIIGQYGKKIKSACRDGTDIYYILENGEIIKAVIPTARTVINPGLYYAAPYVDDIIGTGYANSNRKVQMLHGGLEVKMIYYSENENIIYMIAENNNFLYKLNAATLELEEAVWLRFAPEEIIENDGIWIRFKDANYIYGSGTYIKIPMTAEKIAVNDSFIGIINEKSLYIYDRVKNEYKMLFKPENVIDDVAIKGDLLYVYTIFDLSVYTLETLKDIDHITSMERMFSGGIMLTDKYIVAGEYIFDYNLNLICDTKYEVYSIYGNSVITKYGLYSISENKYIKERIFNYTTAALTKNYDTVILEKDALVSVYGKGKDITVPAEVKGLKNNSEHWEEFTVIFDKGEATLDGVIIKSGHKVSEAGTHVLKVMRPWGITQSYTFKIRKTATGVSLSRDSIRLDIGDTYTIKTTLYPLNSEGELIFASDSDCVSVSSNGVVKAIDFGVAKIRVSIKDKNIYADFTVDVSRHLIPSEPGSGYYVDREHEVLYTYVTSAVKVGSLLDAYTSDDYRYVLKDENGKRIINRNTVLKSGMVLELYSKNNEFYDSLTFVIKGDIDGDGYVTVSDCEILYKALKQGRSFEGYLFSAADFSNNGNINENDLTLMLDAVSGTAPAADGDTEIKMGYPCFVYKDDFFYITLYAGEGTDNMSSVSGMLYYDRNRIEYVSVESYFNYTTIKETDNGIGYTILNINDSFEGIQIIRLYFKVLSVEKPEPLTFIHKADYSNGVLSGTKEMEKTIDIRDNPADELLITIDNAEFVFDKKINEYRISIPLMDEYLKINIDCPAGAYVFFENEIIPIDKVYELELIYIDLDKTEYKYKFIVNRTNSMLNGDTTLDEVYLKGVSTQAVMIGETYYITVPFGYKTADIIAVPRNGGAKISIQGEMGLAVGENRFIIRCEAANGSYNEYTLIIRREDDNVSNGESSGSGGDMTSDTGSEGDQSQSGSKNDVGQAIIIISFIIIILAAGITAVLIYRRKKMPPDDIFDDNN